MDIDKRVELLKLVNGFIQEFNDFCSDYNLDFESAKEEVLNILQKYL